LLAGIRQVETVPEITAPLESATVPEMLPPVAACNKVTAERQNATANTRFLNKATLRNGFEILIGAL
jgi:hypothetical protein